MHLGLLVGQSCGFASVVGEPKVCVCVCVCVCTFYIGGRSLLRLRARHSCGVCSFVCFGFHSITIGGYSRIVQDHPGVAIYQDLTPTPRVRF